MTDFLVPRGPLGGIFKQDSNFTCARPLGTNYGEKLSMGITLQTLMKYITLACLALSTISALFLITKHLHRYTRPKEQRQIIRILWLPVFFCIIALLAIIFLPDSIYFKPLLDVYEAFCVAALLLLYVEYVCPDVQARPKYFNHLEIRDKKGNYASGGGLRWYQKTRFLVLQFPLTKTLAAIAEISTQAANVYCSNSLSPRYAHIWLLVVNVLITLAAVLAVFQFYRKLKTEMDPNHKALAKLVTLKGLVALQFLQQIIFGFVAPKVFKPSSVYTYDDLFYGVPMLLTAIEAMLFSFAFHFAYRSREYRSIHHPGDYRMSTFRAIFDAMNLSDIVTAVFSALATLFSSREHTESYDGIQTYSTGPGIWPTGPAPRRQRTQELNDMALEPLSDPRSRYPNVHGYQPNYNPPHSLPPSYHQQQQQGPSQIVTQDYESYAGMSGIPHDSRGGSGGMHTHVAPVSLSRDASPGRDISAEQPLAPREVV